MIVRTGRAGESIPIDGEIRVTAAPSVPVNRHEIHAQLSSSIIKDLPSSPGLERG
jgi:hypothetical protein